MISRMTDEQIIERFEENERAIAEYKKQLDARERISRLCFGTVHQGTLL
jgi:hypothetical protein